MRRHIICCVSIQYSGWNTHHEISASHSYAFGYESLPGAGEQCTVRSEGLHSPGPVTGRTGSADPSGWPLVEILWRISFSSYSVSHFPSFLQWVNKYYSLVKSILILSSLVRIYAIPLPFMSDLMLPTCEAFEKGCSVISWLHPLCNCCVFSFHVSNPQVTIITLGHHFE